MKCSSNGITMIEIIFVIVMLGILGAVAVPKLEKAQREQAAIKANSAYKADTNKTSEWN